MDDPQAPPRAARGRGRAGLRARGAGRARAAADGGDGACRRERRPVHRRRGRGDAEVAERLDRVEPSRQPRVAEARPCAGGAVGTGVRDAGRRQGDGGAGARAPARAPARAVDPAGERRRRRPRGAGEGTDAGGRGRRPRVTTTLDARVPVYVLIAAGALALAAVTGRPELVLFAAPFALALLSELAERPPRHVRAALAAVPTHAVEGDELTVALRLETDARCRLDVVLVLPPELELVDGLNPVAVVLAPRRPHVHE